ncbi:hypothetical protein A9996_12300 [Gelidibacter algens]|nr:hypothetical protein A9996_12300 [Gelidibacter algens]
MYWKLIFKLFKSTKIEANFLGQSYLYIQRNVYICIPIIIGAYAGVVELVDTLDLGVILIKV